MRARARFVVVEESVFGGTYPLVIKDVGPWDKHLSVTNDAEAVVLELVESGRLASNGQQLFYINSDGQKDEILVQDGRFAGFAPGPRGEAL